MPKPIEDPVFNHAAHRSAHDPGNARVLRWQSISAPGVMIGGNTIAMLDTGIISWMIATMDDEDAPADIVAELVLDGATLGGSEATIATGDRSSPIYQLGDFWDGTKELTVSITDDGGLVGRLAAYVLVAGI